ncbi:MAG: excinuclease ABC subunit UvrC [Gammaproteobacteria bacterium]|nr:excinuclease ABC subunit UvrC [Gammaproteobacteria bacterium]
MTFDPRSFLSTLTSHPGVYNMYSQDDRILYIGKAKNLKKRVASYFASKEHSAKTKALVARIARIETTVTSSETEALLLEQTQIKKHRPPFNIVMRDDKSYPYIFVSEHQEYPRLVFHRGGKKAKGRYFGPYPSSGAVRESLDILQRVFKVRQCDESFFSNRTRPCLQAQIDRCSAPCVNAITPAAYRHQVDLAMRFLQGKNTEIIEELVQKMEVASETLDFEGAAGLRDQIIALRRINEQQFVTGGQGDADVFGVECAPSGVCVHRLMVRGGRVIGGKNYFPKVQYEALAEEVLEGFVPQYYLSQIGGRTAPKEIILPCKLDDAPALQAALSEQFDKKVQILSNVRSQRTGWLKIAQLNAEQSLQSLLASKESSYRRFVALQEALQFDEIPQRLECFDISHTQGEETVASCVVFDRNGPLRSEYRRFNIEGITPGDDYAAMEQALMRRYSKVLKNGGVLPDLIVIDGGKGQMTQALRVREELQINSVTLLGVAKGPTRKAGLEQLFLNHDKVPTVIPDDSPALHLIQHIRDESHRFAIAGHRSRRAKKRKTSALEGIPGVGPKRRRDLINHFGGMQEVMRASEAELTKITGISPKLAEIIYDALHGH